jgi:hypothetical protein
MRASKHGTGPLLLGGVVLLAATTALAEPGYFTYPTTPGKAQVQAGVSYGSDHLNVGLTARGGYTVPFGLYVGGMGDYFFEGDASSAPGGTAKGSAWDLGVEAGYDFGLLGAFVLRPYLGAGIAHGNTTFCPITGGACTENAGNDFFFELGGTASYVGQWFLAGVDLRMLAASEAMWIAGAHVGLLF